MFEPAEYFARIEGALSACDWIEKDGPILKVELNPYTKAWSIISWRFACTFPTGDRFTALESHSLRAGQHFRKIKYRLMRPDAELIFQVDPHTSAIPFDETPHLHIGPTEDVRLHDGDPLMNGFSLKNFDFLVAWDIVQTYQSDGSLPWTR